MNPALLSARLPRSRRGVALVITLGLLVLIVGLVVAFFLTVTTDFSSSSVYAQGVQTRQLADVTVNLVMAQIRDATAGYVRNAGTLDLSQPLAWASQPGMIRTWDNSGNPSSSFCLYSTSPMVLGAQAAPATSATPVNDANLASGSWLYSPALYTDLNSPVLVPIAPDAAGAYPPGTIVPDPVNRPNDHYVANFPILDGNNLVSGATLNPPVVSPHQGAGAVLTYDANQDGVADVEGFFVEQPTTYSTSLTLSPANNPVPMPVQWLYVLADGTLCAPTGGVGSAASKNSQVTVAQATSSNPIVGRVAFWTDDDTCKLNLNTASEGTFWDTPRAASITERNEAYQPNANGTFSNPSAPYGYSSSVPVQSEYQRTPGHPATTCLSSVLGWLMPPGPVGANSTSDYTKYLKPYYDLAPRICDTVDGTTTGRLAGTQGGTYADTISIGNASLNSANQGAQIVTDTDRLYASLDELLFKTIQIPAGTMPPSASSLRPLSPTNNASTPFFTKQALEQSKFFLTVSNAAPDVNLFNQPRVSLWPIQQDAVNARNAKDKLLAFCSTVNNHPFYFQRYSTYQQPYQITDDDYPGSSQSQSDDSPFPVNASGVAVTPKIPRNQDLYKYLKSLTSSNVPGFGGNFASKYPLDQDQILTEMFDTIRTQLNSFYIDLNGQPPTTYSYEPHLTTAFPVSGESSALPTRITPNPSNPSYQGFGVTHTLREMDLIFYASDFKDWTNLNPASGHYPIPNSNAFTDPNSPWYTPPGNVPATLPNPPSMPTAFGYPPNTPPPYPAGTAVPSPDGLPDDMSSDPTTDSSGNLVPGTFDGKGDPQTTEMRAVITIQPQALISGPPAFLPWLRYQLVGLDQLTVTYSNNGSLPVTTNLGFNNGPNAVNVTRQSPGFDGGSSPFYGFFATLGFTTLPITVPSQTLRAPGQCDGTTSSSAWNDPHCQIYPFCGKAVPLVPAANPMAWAPDGTTVRPSLTTKPSTFSFSGGPVTLKIYSAFGKTATGITGAPIQTISLYLPPGNFPVPTIEPTHLYHQYHPTIWHGDYSAPEYNAADTPAKQVEELDGYLSDDTKNNPPSGFDWTKLGAYTGTPTGWSDLTQGSNRHMLTYFARLNRAMGDTPIDAKEKYDPTVSRYAFYQALYLKRGDTVRALEINPFSDVHGDLRLLAALPQVPAQDATGNYYYAPRGGLSSYSSNYRQFQGILLDVGDLRSEVGYSGEVLNANPATWGGRSEDDPRGAVPPSTPNLAGSPAIASSVLPVTNGLLCSFPYGTNGVYQDKDTANKIAGDWSNGSGDMADGAYINRGDQGAEASNSSTYYDLYYHTNFGNINTVTFPFNYSPNRQVASPVIFGSLPVGVQSKTPWRTLLFCPDPAAGSLHGGFGVGTGGVGPSAHAPYNSSYPPDHLFLDLFNMPIVDPYAISGPFYTQGRVNMNYRMMPFNYINRDTGVRAVMKATKLMAIPNQAANWGNSSFKQDYYRDVTTNTYRYDINPDETDGTLAGFEARFSGVDPSNTAFPITNTPADLFHSASEICNIFLVPKESVLAAGSGVTYNAASVPANYAATAAWWNNFLFTGDNTREAPYNSIYPRLTTKSNTFTVHYRVQALKKSASDGLPATTWDETRDQTLGELRGSTTLERYIDPDDTTLPDFATLAAGSANSNLDAYYRFRVLGTRKFNP